MGARLPLQPTRVLSVRKDVTVMDAIRAMVERNVSATIVLEGETLVGIFTERDAVARVLLKRLDAETTQVGEVMTASPVTVREDADRSSALRLMSDRHIRHLPVVDLEGRVLTMLSMRHLLRAEVNDLRQTVWELVAETAIDGAGG
jgi:CBS domain-containing protein